MLKVLRWFLLCPVYMVYNSAQQKSMSCTDSLKTILYKTDSQFLSEITISKLSSHKAFISERDVECKVGPTFLQ